MDHLIVCENISKIYRVGDMEVQALREIDLTIDRGEFLAVMGASGSGKSTLMNILGCLDQPTRGRYLLDGMDVDGKTGCSGGDSESTHRVRVSEF